MACSAAPIAHTLETEFVANTGEVGPAENVEQKGICIELEGTVAHQRRIFIGQVVNAKAQQQSKVPFVSKAEIEVIPGRDRGSGKYRFGNAAADFRTQGSRITRA
jgi:hypothetical protein